MSLTFRNVPRITRRSSRSKSRTKRTFKTKYYEASDSLDEESFPPLKAILPIAHRSTYLDCSVHDFLPVKLTNRKFLEENSGKSFEEVRFEFYRTKVVCGKSYSQCFVKNEFCFKKLISSISNELKQDTSNTQRDRMDILSKHLVDQKEANVNISKQTSLVDILERNSTEVKQKLPAAVLPKRPQSQINRCKSITNITISPVAIEQTDIKEEPSRPVKGRSILTQPTSMFQNVTSQQSLFQEHLATFSNATWYLQENLTNQFGFDRILNSVHPIFKEGNLYAECYGYPTVPKDIFRTIVVEESPLMKKKKDFKVLFSPYRKVEYEYKGYFTNNVFF